MCSSHHLVPNLLVNLLLPRCWVEGPDVMLMAQLDIICYIDSWLVPEIDAASDVLKVLLETIMQP